VVGSTFQHGGVPRINLKLLRALVDRRLITAAQASSVEAYARAQGIHIEEALIETGMLEEVRLLRFQAEHYRTYFVSTQKLARANISHALLRLVHYRLANTVWIFPVKYDARRDELSILTIEPDDVDLLKRVQLSTRVASIKALVARPAAIAAAIRRHFLNDDDAFEQVPFAGEAAVPAPTTAAPAPGTVTTVVTRPQPETPVVASDTAPELPAPSFARLSAREASHATVPMYASPTSGASDVTAAEPSPAVQRSAPVIIQASATSAAPAQPASEVVAAAPGLVSASATAAFTLPAPAPALSTEDASHAISMADYIETLNVLVALLEQERGELRGHSMMVVRIVRRMCERLDLPADEADAVIIAAYLHDLGKTSSLHLTAYNAAQYDAHGAQARKSYLTPLRLFEAVRLPDKVSDALTHLYERFDGQGFPDGLSAKQIPIGARILAIAETYADLTGQTGNVFQRKFSAVEALELIARHKQKLFDSMLVDVLKLVVLGGDLRAQLLADRRRALLVEPDAEEAIVLSLRLIEHGFDVTAVRNASDAEAELAHEFDIIISEVELMPIDGFALLQRARAGNNEVPFVFLSQKDDSEIAKRSFELGAGDFITKPASADVVALKVLRVLSDGRKRRTGGVSGSLTEMALPDMIQVLSHGRKSGKLVVHADGKLGELHFSDGQIFDASFGSAQQEEAVYQMLRLSQGNFELDPNFRPLERKIALTPESLLLEGMRRIDELRR